MNEVFLYYTNDFHSHVPKAIGMLKTLIRARTASSIVVDTGDFSEGSPFFNLFGGVPEKKIIQKVYDFVAPGNHGFRDILDLYKQGFPVLNSNILLDGLPLFQAAKIVVKEKHKFGFVGIMSPEAFHAIETNFRRSLLIADPFDVLDEILPLLKSKVDKVIVLSHSGIDYDITIAEKFQEIDVILSSHCHSSILSVNVNNVLIAKAPELGKGFGELKISNDGSLSSRLHSSFEEDAETDLDFLNPLRDQYKSCLNKRLFWIPDEFAQQYSSRSKLASHIVENIIKDISPDFCILNSHTLRGILPSGWITFEDIYQCTPFDNKLIKFTASRRKLFQILESLSCNARDYLHFNQLQVESDLIEVVTTDYLEENIFHALEKFQYTNLLEFRTYLQNYCEKRFHKQPSI